jgi:hypothetical protein
LVNRSNIDASLLADYEVKDPRGIVINNGIVNFSIAASESSTVMELSKFTYTFSQSGQYPVKINILSGSDILSTGSDAIHVSPSIRVEPSKTLSPTAVTPDGDKRIKINILLKGVGKK